MYQFDEAPPAPGARFSLQEYFNRIYRPRLILAGSKKPVVNKYDRAVRKMEEFVGRDVAIEEISLELLTEFSKWLRASGHLQSYCTDLKQIVGTICRAYNPSKYRKGCRPLVDPDPEPGTLRHFFETTYRPQRLFDAKLCSLRQFLTMFRYQRRHYGRDLCMSELSDALAADHLAWCYEQGIKPTTVNNTHRATWYAVWRFAMEQGLVERAPTVRKLREGHNVPDAWSIEEINTILAHTPAAYGKTIDGIAAEKYWDALIRVAWWTGLRRGALLQIRRTDVSLKTGWLTVPPEHMKNRVGQKFRLGDDAIEAIEAIQDPPRLLLFPWPFEIRLLSKQFNRILKAAGLPPSPRRMGLFHKLRRSTATKMCELAGIEAASSLLGHSASDVTKRYIDPSLLPGHDMTKILPSLGSPRASRTA